jgi:hypothetical protein
VPNSGGRPGDESAVTQLTALPSAERHVLAAVAVVGHASLSESDLAELVEVDDVRPLIADLERRGLIAGDDHRRYSLLGNLGEEIRKTDDALATGDQLMQYVQTLARAGALTPARLADDAQAILELSQWAAENRQWASLLELVQTLQSCFAIAERVQQLLALLERGRTAARALGDRQSEVWTLQQMATASTQAGDTAAARKYLQEADELQRGLLPGAGRAAAVGDGVPRPALWIACLALVGMAGLGAGYRVGADNGHAGTTTTTVPVGITAHGSTVTTSIATTLPALTVTLTTTQPTTVTETTTVTTTPPIP